MTGLSILSSLSFLFIQAGGLQQRKQQSQQRRDYRTTAKGLEQKVSPQHSTEPPPLLLVLETHVGVRQILPHDPTLFQSLFTMVCRSSQICSVGIWHFVWQTKVVCRPIRLEYVCEYVLFTLISRSSSTSHYAGCLFGWVLVQSTCFCAQSLCCFCFVL